MKVILRYILLTFLILTFMLMTLLQSNTSKNEVVKKLDQFLLWNVNSPSEIKQTNHHAGYLTEGVEYDKYCDEHGDWANLGDGYFFQKSASFYFTDLHMIMLNFLQHHKHESNVFSLKLELKVELNFAGKRFNLVDELTNYEFYQNTRHMSPYGYNLIKVDFNLRSFLQKKIHLSDTKLKRLVFDRQIHVGLNIIDTSRNESLKTPIDLVIKDTGFNAPKPNKIALCAKIVSIEHDYEFDNFKRWVELTHRLGYEKIFVYLQEYPPLSRARQDFLTANRRLIEAERLNCLPNILDSKEFKNFKYLRMYRGWMFERLDTIAAFMQSVCYLRNMDKFAYIMASDADELGVLGAQYGDVSMQSVHFRKYLNEVSKISLTDLLLLKHDHLYRVDVADDRSVDIYAKAGAIFKRQSTGASSVHLEYKLFVHSYNMDRMCSQLKGTIEKHGQHLHELVSGAFYLRDLDDRLLNEQDVVRNFTVRINGRNELLYAFYLCELNRVMIEPLIKKQAHSTFDRYFYLRIENGKSLHDTNRAFLFNSHEILLSYEYSTEDGYTHVSEQWSTFENDYKLGYTGHFRYDPKMDFYYSIIDIANVRLDLSFFKFLSF